MIRIAHFPPNAAPNTNLSLHAASAALQQPGFLWISLEQPSREETLSVLSGLFHFHPLAIEDCLSDGYQTPKIDDFQDYIFIIAHAVHSNQNFEELETSELNLFLGKNYLVSYFKDHVLSPTKTIWNRLDRDERLYQRGSDYLCYAILDQTVDEYLPLIDRVEDEIDALEDIVLAHPTPTTLQRILQLKHAIMTIRRIISPQREVLNRLSRDEFPQIDAYSRIYFRDIYDHLVRIQDMTESLRDIVAGDLDIYLNSTSLRLNEVMKALTIVSTIFLPLSFVAGVYGMNFQYMPELSQRWAYPLVWLVFFLITTGMLWFFKKRKWF
jgi:magnesium transporter